MAGSISSAKNRRFEEEGRRLITDSYFRQEVVTIAIHNFFPTESSDYQNTYLKYRGILCSIEISFFYKKVFLDF